jgi:hypothetical protein
MKQVLGLGLILASLPSLVLAVATVTDLSQPYAPVDLESSIKTDQIHLGELADFPLMYEFMVADSTELQFGLSQKYQSDPILFRSLLVREEDSGRGVREVMRFETQAEDWVVNKDDELGLTLYESETFTRELDPGVYRLEISTPDNLGKFMLKIGEFTESPSYLARLQQTATIQAFFDYSFLRILSSSLVYYPLGIILLLLAIQQTFKYRRYIINAN